MCFNYRFLNHSPQTVIKVENLQVSISHHYTFSRHLPAWFSRVHWTSNRSHFKKPFNIHVCRLISVMARRSLSVCPTLRSSTTATARTAWRNRRLDLRGRCCSTQTWPTKPWKPVWIFQKLSDGKKSLCEIHNIYVILLHNTSYIHVLLVFDVYINIKYLLSIVINRF